MHQYGLSLCYWFDSFTAGSHNCLNAFSQASQLLAVTQEKDAEVKRHSLYVSHCSALDAQHRDRADAAASVLIAAKAEVASLTAKNAVRSP